MVTVIAKRSMQNATVHQDPSEEVTTLTEIQMSSDPLSMIEPDGTEPDRNPRLSFDENVGDIISPQFDPQNIEIPFGCRWCRSFPLLAL